MKQSTERATVCGKDGEGMRFNELRKEPVLLALVLFFFCLTAGALAGRLSIITMGDKAKAQVLSELYTAVHGSIPYGKLIRYCLVRNALVAMSILFFSLCIIGNYYYLFRIAKRGLLVGFLFGQLCGVFGNKGILLGLTYYFPAWFFYLPAYFLYYRIAYRLWRTFFRNPESAASLRAFWPYKKTLLFWLLIFLFGGLVEATLGSLLLQAVGGNFC